MQAGKSCFYRFFPKMIERLFCLFRTSYSIHKSRKLVNADHRLSVDLVIIGLLEKIVNDMIDHVIENGSVNSTGPIQLALINSVLVDVGGHIMVSPHQKE